MSAQFTHFIVIQALTLLLAYICNSLSINTIIVKIMFLYSVLLIFSIAFGFLHLSQLVSIEKDKI
jgi:hypothetical protein